MVGRVDGDRLGTRQHEHGQECAGLQVVDADVRPRGDVQTVAARDLGRARTGGPGPALLDRDVRHRHAERARGRHAVVPERDEPSGHHVLGEVRVGPLVDRVRLAVAPVLQELGCRAGVVDLVEVHPQRLAEPERPQEQRRDDEHHDEPQVEPVEPPAALVVEQLRAIEGRAAGDGAHAAGSPPQDGPEREPRARRRVGRSRGRAGAGRPVRAGSRGGTLGVLREQRGCRVGLLRCRPDQVGEPRHEPARVDDRAARHPAP